MSWNWIFRMRELKLTQDITYVAEGNGAGEIGTIKDYPTGAVAGSPAILTTFTYDGDNKVIKIEVTKTTV